MNPELEGLKQAIMSPEVQVGALFLLGALRGSKSRFDQIRQYNERASQANKNGAPLRVLMTDVAYAALDTGSDWAMVGLLAQKQWDVGINNSLEGLTIWSFLATNGFDVFRKTVVPVASFLHERLDLFSNRP